jgi:aminoglycoside phosphotransferase (APT) family kinase protein
MAMHPGQIHVDERTVRRLIHDQFPQWRGMSVEAMQAAGTVNAIFRIGPDLAARFPLLDQEPAEAWRWLTAEAAAAREFAEAATVPTTEPVALGAPGHGYPMPWSIQTWLPGNDATVEDPEGSTEFAHDLAALITSLRAADTHGRRFAGHGRGGHLPDHDQWLERCFQQSESLLDVPLMREIWADLRRLPAIDADAMCHGDLTPPNVLVGGGRLVGVLDGGALGPADPALDLVAAWHLLGEQQREWLRFAVGCSDIQWRRGMAWAFQQAMGLVWYYVDSNPAMARWGLRSLNRLVRAGGV